MSADDFFSGGSKSAKFEQMNVPVGGQIVSVGPARQQTEPNGDLKWWDKRETEPMMQLPIEVQTDLRDPADPTDDGVRTIYVKGDMKRAVGEAVRKVGQRGAPKVGGTLLVAWVGTEPATVRGYNDKKLYSAKYAPPAAGDDFFGQPAPQQAAPQVPAQQSAAPPWASAPQPASVGALASNGEPPSPW